MCDQDDSPSEENPNLHVKANGVYSINGCVIRGRRKTRPNIVVPLAREHEVKIERQYPKFVRVVIGWGGESVAHVVVCESAKIVPVEE